MLGNTDFSQKDSPDFLCQKIKKTSGEETTFSRVESKGTMSFAQQSQRAVKNSEWDVADLLASGGETIRCVFRRQRTGPWEPWVIEAESALLDAVGAGGKGLYAARKFKHGECIGRYDGEVVKTFRSRKEAIESPECDLRLRRGSDKLITRKPTTGPGVELVDGTTGGFPLLQRMNDPRGTRYKANVELTEGGWARVAQKRGVPAFDLTAGKDVNIAAELRFSYGEGYWERIARSPEDAMDLLDTDSDSDYDPRGEIPASWPPMWRLPGAR